MARKYVRFVFGIAIAVILNTVVFAQNSSIASAAGDKYVISAKAGGVNYTEGTVSVVRKNDKSGYLLKGDALEIGDRVTTGSDGRAEILLNPGSFIRLGANSSFEFKTTSLDDLKIRLESGNAMFEVFATRDFKVTVVTPKGKLTLVESGIFRVDVQKGGVAKVSVWSGKAELGDVARTIIKKGQAATINGFAVSVSKFDRDERDELTTWSKTRGKALAKASTGLKNQAMRGSLLSSFNRGSWGLYNSFGLWVYDARFSNWCFLPFGSGWYSPYNYGYGSNIWWYNLPPVIYTPPSGGGNPNGPTSAPMTAPIRVRNGREEVDTAPFVRVQNSGGVSRKEIDSGFPGGNSGGGNNGGGIISGPIYSAPAPPPITTKSGSSDVKVRDN